MRKCECLRYSNEYRKELAMSYFRFFKLSSALKCLTSVFGMGTGVSTSPSSPNSLSKLDILVYKVKSSTY